MRIRLWLEEQVSNHLVRTLAVPIVLGFVIIALLLDFVTTRQMQDLVLTSTANSLKAVITVNAEQHLKPEHFANPAAAQAPGVRDFTNLLHDANFFTRINLIRPDGLIVWSSTPAQVGQPSAPGTDLAAAIAGTMHARLDEEAGTKHKALEMYLPLFRDGQVMGVVEAYYWLDAALLEMEQARMRLRTVVYSGAALASLALLGLATVAAGILRRQQVDLVASENQLAASYKETIQALAAAVDARDPYTHGHSGRVSRLAGRLATRLGWSRRSAERLEWGALLHDIGKIGVPDSILNKPQGLTEEEYERVKAHVNTGAEMIRGVTGLEDMMPGIRFHHERMDGQGYPLGLKGDQIPLTARIIAVADAYDALTSTRPYRRGSSPQEALQRLQEAAGSHLDPALVKLLVEHPEIVVE